MFRLRILGLALICASSAAYAADDVKIDFHGIVGTTMYMQTTPGLLLNGEGPLLLQNTNSAATFGADVRQSRLSLSATGPSVMGASARGLIEGDFFGLDTPGNYGEVSAAPRLRLAYAELKWDNGFTLRAGQDWELLWAQHADSQAHIAFPTNYFAGLVGWREPGFSLYYNTEMASSKWEFAAQINKSDWQNPYNLGSSTKNDLNVDAGQLSAKPAVELRAKWAIDSASAYIVGHYNRVGASHANAQPYQGTDVSPAITTARDFDVQILKIGGKYAIAHFSLMVELYMGQNLGPLIGNFNQFVVSNDVKESGGWAQLAYSINDEDTVMLDYGTAAANSGDADNSGQNIRSNSTATLMYLHKVGNFALAPEISTITTNFKASQQSTAQQYALSANYYF